MKKILKSFVVLILLCSFILTVSCPPDAKPDPEPEPEKEASISITSPVGNDAKVSLQLGSETASATLDVVAVLTNDAFNREKIVTTEGSETDLASWFTLSDTTKVSLTAKAKALEEENKKITISVTFTSVAATEQNKPVTLTFKVPKVTEGQGWTTSGKELTTENEIAVTVQAAPESPKTPVEAKIIGTNQDPFEVVDGSESWLYFAVQLVGATWKKDSVDSVTSFTGLPQGSTVKFYNLLDPTEPETSGKYDSDKRGFELHSPQDAPNQDEAPFTINLDSSWIEPSEGYKIPDDGLSISYNLFIDRTEAASKTDIGLRDSVSSGGNSNVQLGPYEISKKNEVQTFDLIYTLDGANVKDISKIKIIDFINSSNATPYTEIFKKYFTWKVSKGESSNQFIVTVSSKSDDTFSMSSGCRVIVSVPESALTKKVGKKYPTQTVGSSGKYNPMLHWANVNVQLDVTN